MKAGPAPAKKRLGFGRVNAHHGWIKTLVNGRCRGAATRYPPGCLGWHRAMMRGSLMDKALLDRSLFLAKHG